MDHKTGRRDFLNQTLLGAAGVGAALGMEEKILMAAVQDGTAAVPKPKVDVDPKNMPQGKIGKISMSRLLMGGNLIGGWAHSRDLLYVSRLFKAYNTEAKVFETLEMAEQCGINTIQVDPRAWDGVLKHNRERGGKMQTMVCILPNADKVKMADHIKSLVDQGATLLYTHGMMADELVRSGRIEVLANAIELMKAQGVPGGIGSHSLEVPMACEKHDLGADYYVKTFHQDNYWSATIKDKREEWCWYKAQSSEPGTYHDNMFCIDPEKTTEFMAGVKKPWVAFKVMAAGAIHPGMAFAHAFRHGADFIIAGMFDFQIEQDVKLAATAARTFQKRSRPWYT